MGKKAENARRGKKMTVQEQRKMRLEEIRNKIKILRGTADAGKAYKKKRDQERESSRGGRGPRRASDEEEGGEGQASRSWKRSVEKRAQLATDGVISDEARAVANTELAGAGKATARQLLECAFEFEGAGDFDDAGELLELARKRIDTEQIQGNIDYKEAKTLDDDTLWQLAELYERSGRLTLAADRFGELKGKLVDGNDRLQAEQRWAQVNFKLGSKLYDVRRFDEALQVLRSVQLQGNLAGVGQNLWEEIDLYSAMTLQKLGRVEEAKELLAYVARTSGSRTRKSQANFVLEVMSVDTAGQKNEEFQKMWDQNFVLPKDSFAMSAQTRIGTGGANLNLTPSERKWREWASDYWEERLKSPLYYAFLTLWVTWPFAIPVVALWGKPQPPLPPL